MSDNPSLDLLQEAMAAALGDPQRAALIVQLLYVVQEPVYERALRQIVNMSPECCAQICDALERASDKAPAKPSARAADSIVRAFLH